MAVSDKLVHVSNDLKIILVDTYALLLKTHGFHWNVTGREFLNLHSLFETQYRELFEAVDTVAERIRALGDYAPGGLKNYAKISSLEDPHELADSDMMLKVLSEDHRKLGEKVRHGIERAVAAGDYVTADILTERARSHDKQIWMMGAIVGTMRTGEKQGVAAEKKYAA